MKRSRRPDERMISTSRSLGLHLAGHDVSHDDEARLRAAFLEPGGGLSEGTYLPFHVWMRPTCPTSTSSVPHPHSARTAAPSTSGRNRVVSTASGITTTCPAAIRLVGHDVFAHRLGDGHHPGRTTRLRRRR